MDNDELAQNKYLALSLILFFAGSLVLSSLMNNLPGLQKENATPTPEPCGCNMTTLIFHTGPVNSTNYSGTLNMTYSNITFSSGDGDYSYANESQYVRQNITLTNNTTLNWPNATYAEWTGSIPRCGCK